ncbi:rod shape-determining protein MreC [Campylobacter lari]|uniref:rod shape-determining protein MreC n=1 Tax=Campylobacter lari TaxID=201 RepID=UPI001271DCBE|nr:rod shape-determining protein MreC [Campylobacter lari]MBT0741777.1 rod shape-determining protein MreC [Campylobacter lari]MCR6539334.1 rod shape-determining protein MreC [Campylobacter lari]
MKSKILSVLILSFLVFISFYYGDVIKRNVLDLNIAIVNQFSQSIDLLKNKFNEHFNQAEEIRTLRERNAELEKNNIYMKNFANELNNILSDKNSSFYYPNVSLVKATSYAQISDYHKVWLDVDYKGTIKGLIYNGYTAGIVIEKNGRALGLLQGDEECIFSVYIGKEQAPGIAHGRNDYVLVKYIPKWLELKMGDKVYTSGLDEIFFSGIPVGEIFKIEEEGAYQNAYVKPYAKMKVPSYFYMVENL